eukprot:TRINITY_DN51489_c0_g1_i1.p1 TRINITY_DN51489_c0_g1~~TRINITY_DN51489_c0_g1_i1.p1  ORF type:complete len:163 (-),score=30.81 TRINITY_DN51489_c0_g1_i1:137-625(-)
MLPLLFFAQATVSSSVLFFEAPTQIQTAVSPPKPAHLNTPSVELSTTRVMGVIVVAGAAHVALLVSNQIETLGWLVLATLSVVTASGLHMVWTHVWLFGSGAALLTGSELALATAACLGANISVVWYTCLVTRREMRVPDRAMQGWSRWICEDLFNLSLIHI